MEFVYDKILVPHKHSFIAKKVGQKGIQSPRMHSHKNYELNYVLSGAGRRIVGNNISSFEDNDLVIIGPDLAHCWELGDQSKNLESTCVVIHFYENVINSGFFNVPELEKVKELLKQANSGIWVKGKMLPQIKARLENLITLDGLESYIELLQIFNLVLKSDDIEYLSDNSGNPTVFSKDIDRVNKVYEYVFKNIQNTISLNDAAELLCMAPGSFSRYFKRKTNKTFSQYVKSVRIGLAAKLLAETDKQITAICFESGYNNLANFNHQFKVVMNKTPSDYRKSFR
ncbi:AraC family transcriptional regulator [Fulvivirgaceae bacterium BMA12]|uniref:AraC family transcriptional regulator n=1 Tax=Agaribacillus aureus TaxID=3051825 RepID=A0ABT8LKV5_9BACT|nr:AraC family transcriptional regulator [Fulvivirgaceae bacterium BMA12]